MKTYNVTFIHNSYTLSTTVQANNEEEAETKAEQRIQEEAFLDLSSLGKLQINIEEN